MPWEVQRPMNSRMKFAEAASLRSANISALCREYGISRQTGHKWLKRYRERGYAGLEELSRRPASSPSMTGHAVVQAVLALRERHPSWGPQTLSQVLGRDPMSRMVLAVVVVKSTRGAMVRQVLEKLFAKYGVPRALLMDNGSPWVSTRSRAGLTKLSAWLLSLGIRLHRSRPASPQDNGGHERMHRDLTELRLSPGASRRAQQPLCDRWTLDFNHVR